MTGYDIERFANSTEAIEFICNICLGVYRNPMSTECKHIFCYDCITEWCAKQLETPPNREARCPLCRQSLALVKVKRGSSDTNQLPKLRKTNSKFAKSLSGLKIRCGFGEYGCQKIVGLGALEKHEKECQHNRCDICGLKRDEHNCIKSLKSQIEAINAKLDAMKHENDMMAEIASRYEYLESKMKNIHDLVDDRVYLERLILLLLISLVWLYFVL